jgi:hypothetical protein
MTEYSSACDGRCLTSEESIPGYLHVYVPRQKSGKPVKLLYLFLMNIVLAYMNT